jgi:hypothetical protein
MHFNVLLCEVKINKEYRKLENLKVEDHIPEQGTVFFQECLLQDSLIAFMFYHVDVFLV